LSLPTSSIIVSCHRQPVFGADALVEAVLGGIFGYIYILSGYNLVVPIIVHSVYDFATIFFTWLSASSDLKQRFSAAVKYQPSEQIFDDPYKIESLSRAVSCLHHNTTQHAMLLPV
jgi:hypothetical protein